MENEMIERVARALAEQAAARAMKADRAAFEGAFLGGIAEYAEWRHQNYADDARAAIEAMRERNEAMLDAGTAVLLPYAARMVPGPGSTAVAVWTAMIDAALTASPLS